MSLAKLEIVRSRSIDYWHGICHLCEWKYYQATRYLQLQSTKKIPLSHHADKIREHLFHAHGIQSQKTKPRTYEQMLIDAHRKHQTIIKQRNKEGVNQCK